MNNISKWRLLKVLDWHHTDCQSFFIYLQHSHTDLRSFCYNNSDICIITYSVGSRTSFNNARDFWIPEAKRRMKSRRSIILVGCQSEHRFDRRNSHVAFSEGLNLSEESGLRFFQECSSKSLNGVREVFENVVSFTIKMRRNKNRLLKRLQSLTERLSCIRPRGDTL